MRFNFLESLNQIQRRPRIHESPTDPEGWLSTHLCQWAGSARDACKGYSRAVPLQADLRAEGYVVNRGNVQRIWREEGLRVARNPSRKLRTTTTYPITGTDAPNVVEAIDFPFNSLRCGTSLNHSWTSPKLPLPVRR